jgi:release factor glutamine methyltransferase
MVARRVAGEPLQYVLGEWAFRTLDVMVDRRVLIPRPETEIVAGHAIAELDRVGADDPVVVDLGTGSGVIGLAIAVERPRTRVWLADISTDALAVARANLAGIGRAATNVTIAEGSWFDALPTTLQGQLHVVVSNPPYIAADEDLPASVREWEPSGALVSGPSGREALDELVDEAGRWLVAGGALVLELAPAQAHEVAAQARAQGYVDVEVHPDLTGRDRVVVARRAS